MTNPADTASDSTDEAQAGGAATEVTDAWREAIAARRTREPEGATVAATQVSQRDRELSRRRFIQSSFWAGLGASLAGIGVYFADFIYPRGIEGFGGPVPAGKVTDYRIGGDPKHFLDGQFWIVNLDPAEDRPGGSDGGEGLIALWHKCPHLGCTVPWKAGFKYDLGEGEGQGWFRCPCHGSTYTKAGVRVFGPAPRSMDTMAIDIDGNGNITVQTGSRVNGSADNPTRAVPV